MLSALGWFVLGVLCYAVIDRVMGMISARLTRKTMGRMRGEILDRQAKCFNMTRRSGETDAQLYTRMTEFMRNPRRPGGEP